MNKVLFTLLAAAIPNLALAESATETYLTVQSQASEISTLTDELNEVTTPALDQLKELDKEALDQRYAEAEVGEIPDGDSIGIAMFMPGSPLNGPLAKLAALVWQGKVFDKDKGTLYNKVFGQHKIMAKVYLGKSLWDGKPSIIIDYSETSVLVKSVRDEIRMLDNGLYLGKAYIKGLDGKHHFALDFALDFNH